jgi:hypothetical protein
VWVPDAEKNEPNCDAQASRLILRYTGDVFCRLAKEEREVLSEYQLRNKGFIFVVFSSSRLSPVFIFNTFASSFR